MTKKVAKSLVAVVFCASVIGVLANVASVRAASSSIEKKWMLTAFYNCLRESNNIHNPINSKDSGLVADSVFRGGEAKMPSQEFFKGITSDTRECADIYKGFAAGQYSFNGITGYMGFDSTTLSWTNISDAAELLKKTGYSGEGENYTIQISGKKRAYRSAIENGQETDPTTNINGKAYVKTSESDFTISVKVDDNANITLKCSNIKCNSGKSVVSQSGSTTTIVMNSETGANAQYTVYKKMDSTLKELQSLIGQQSIVDAGFWDTMSGNAVLYTYDYQSINGEVGSAEYKFTGNPSEVAAKAGGMSSISDFNLTDDERYELYRYYFDKAVSNVGERASCTEEGKSIPENATEVHLKSGDQWVSYYFYTSEIAMDMSFNDIFGGSFRTVTTGDIIGWFNQHPAQSEECSTPDDAIDPIVAENTDDIDCFNAGGALGWILCPIISFVQDTITSIYDSIISNFLDVDAKYFDFGGSVYGAWQTFQSFANVIFVIVFLITIFSQVTGFGIDNLGIKRILPKLIVAAILINLSYIICQLMVDLSNILGVGLKNLFEGIHATTSSGGTDATTYGLSGIMTLAVSGAVGALAVGTAGIWGAVVIIPLLLGLLSTLFGVLFFFVILGVRQALVVILVVVSPVAFACYMLPNTKSIFDRWFKTFEGLLLVYPICGALMGGSAFASSVLMALDTGFLGKLIAMLVGVVPFFFIPTLLRNSMSAMGNIGARISNFGRGMGGRLTGAIARSDTVKEAQLRMNAGVDAEGNTNWLGRRRMAIADGKSIFSKIPGMSRMNRRANAQARGAYAKYLSDQMREQNLNSPDFFKKYQRSQEMSAEKDALQTEIDNVNDKTQKGENQTALFSMYDAAVASGNKYQARAIAEIAGRRKDTANAFIEKFKTDSEGGVYDSHNDVFSAVAKQIATGDNSKNYRAGNAMGFEYASQVTQGRTSDNYGTWKADKNNVHDAIDHHVTNGSELYGQSKKSIEELGDRASDSDKRLLAELAARAQQEGREGGTYDITKEKALDKLQEGFNTGAQPGGVFNVRGGGGGIHAIQSDRPAGQTIRQANGAPLNTRLTGAGMERFRQHYQNKVDNRTATRQDYNALKRINRAIDEQNNNNNNNNDNNGQA